MFKRSKTIGFDRQKIIQRIIQIVIVLGWLKLLFNILYTQTDLLIMGWIPHFAFMILVTGLLVYIYHQINFSLTQHEREYKNLFEKNPVAMWVYDIDSLKFLMVNEAAEKLYGYTSDEFLNMKISQIRPLEDVPALLSNMTDQDFDQSYHQSGQWRHLKKNGEMIYAEVSSYKIVYKGIKASWVLSYDITEKVMQDIKLQMLNQELEESVKSRTQDLLRLNTTLISQNKTIKDVNQNLSALTAELESANIKISENAELKSRFVSMASHEFKTPLATISLAVGFIKKYNGKITSEVFESKVDSIERQLTHMNTLLNDVLIVGQNDHSNEVEFSILKLPGLVRKIVSEVQQAGNNSHQIVTHGIEGLPPAIKMNEKLFRNIFINLLSNAIKYSPGVGKINLQISMQDDEISFRIEDFGIGISADDINKIFEPFYRVESNKNIEGTGLGLCIVKRAVELVNGKLDISSVLGKGSVFTVVLPVLVLNDEVIKI